MMFRAVRLEREIDRAVDQWLRWLARWDPVSARRRAVPCETCPRWAAELGFDDLPHGVLHALVTPVAAIVDDCAVRAASMDAQRDPENDFELLSGRIRDEAVHCILARSSAIASNVAVHIEPKVQWLSDQLLMEIGV